MLAIWSKSQSRAELKVPVYCTVEICPWRTTVVKIVGKSCAYCNPVLISFSGRTVPEYLFHSVVEAWHASCKIRLCRKWLFHVQLFEAWDKEISCTHRRCRKRRRGGANSSFRCGGNCCRKLRTKNLVQWFRKTARPWNLLGFSVRGTVLPLQHPDRRTIREVPDERRLVYTAIYRNWLTTVFYRNRFGMLKQNCKKYDTGLLYSTLARWCWGKQIPTADNESSGLGNVCAKAIPLRA